MIVSLQGVLQFKQPPWVVVDVNGIGYELEAPLSVFYELPEIGERVVLSTHLVVREDAQLLFGFNSAAQRDVFRMLIKLNGVGPKVALAVLSTLSIAELAACAANQDVAMLTRVPGIGQKTAQRMMVELDGKLDSGIPTEAGQRAAPVSATEDAIKALEGLGYKQNDAARVVRSLSADLSSEDIIRQALRQLSGNVLAN